MVNDPANAHSGNYVAKSGAIGHSANTELSVTLNVSSAGNIKFWRKVSSELNYDFLRFSIDGEEKGSWSGTLPWAQFSYPVTTGPSTLSNGHIPKIAQYLLEVIVPGLMILPSQSLLLVVKLL